MSLKRRMLSAEARMYKHTVQYYETDKMGVAHHSNYIRWMEEARIDLLSSEGWSYARLEEAGVFSPVTEIRCSYKNPAHFPDEILIDVKVLEYSGVRLKVGYRMSNGSGTVCEAESEHCFVNADGRPVRLKNEAPGLDGKLKELASGNKE